METLSTNAIAAIAGSVLVAWVAIVWAGPFALDLLMAASALPVAIAATWAARHRALARSLPLEVSPRVLCTLQDGIDVYAFRVRLGHGRSLSGPRAEVHYHPADGAPVSLQVLVPCDRICGPWTFLASDPGGLCNGAGAFSLRVTVVEAGRAWSVDHRFPTGSVRSGRFAAGFDLQRGRWVWDRDRWDEATT